MSLPRIDAHHHLWKYSREEYPWMSASMGCIRRDFFPADFAAVLKGAGFDGAVTVQARQTVAETRWLLELANRHEFIRGVVGWAPLTEPGVAQLIETVAASPKLKALRHVLHDEVDDFYMLRDDFNRGVAGLSRFKLVYDLLIFERHLPQTIEFVDRHPRQVFVLDHVAKPRIRDGIFSPWRENLNELAKRPNVFCKLSGMVTEAEWGMWSEDQLRPYVDVVLSAFGPQRLMFGSDWPVVLVASDYSRWAGAATAMLSTLSEPERDRIFGGTAIEVYRLQ